MTSLCLFNIYTSSAESFWSKKCICNVKLSITHHLPPHITKKESSYRIAHDDLLGIFITPHTASYSEVALNHSGVLSTNSVNDYLRRPTLLEVSW